MHSLSLRKYGKEVEKFFPVLFRPYAEISFVKIGTISLRDAIKRFLNAAIFYIDIRNRRPAQRSASFIFAIAVVIKQ